MTRPNKGSGKTTEWREDLNALRRLDKGAFEAKIEQVKQLYQEHGSVGRVVVALGIGKRTFERAMLDIPELKRAVDSARTMFGR